MRSASENVVALTKGCNRSQEDFVQSKATPDAKRAFVKAVVG